MPYVALKPCSFAGNSYRVGEAVPDEVILPGAAKNLITMKVIAPQADTTATPNTAPAPAVPATIPIMMHGLEFDGMKGDVQLDITPEGLQQVFDVLTGSTADAEPIIDAMTDAQALLLLNLTDKRKTVQAATAAKGEALSETEEAGEE